MKRYLFKRREIPDKCPKCGSKNTVHWGLEFVFPFLEDAVTCEDCGFTYGEIYKWVKWVPTGKYSEEKEAKR